MSPVKKRWILLAFTDRPPNDIFKSRLSHKFIGTGTQALSFLEKPDYLTNFQAKTGRKTITAGLILLLDNSCYKITHLTCEFGHAHFLLGTNNWFLSPVSTIGLPDLLKIFPISGLYLHKVKPPPLELFTFWHTYTVTKFPKQGLFTKLWSQVTYTCTVRIH